MSPKVHWLFVMQTCRGFQPYHLFVPLHAALQGLLRCLVFPSDREGYWGAGFLWGFGIKITHRDRVHGSSKQHGGSLLLKAALPSLFWNWDSAWAIFSLVSRCLRAVTEFHTRLLPLLIMAPAAQPLLPGSERLLPGWWVHTAKHAGAPGLPRSAWEALRAVGCACIRRQGLLLPSRELLPTLATRTETWFLRKLPSANLFS